MALRTARRLVVRGRPPGRAAGRTGATKAHAASVRSVSLFQDTTATFQTPSYKRSLADFFGILWDIPYIAWNIFFRKSVEERSAGEKRQNVTKQCAQNSTGRILTATHLRLLDQARAECWSGPGAPCAPQDRIW